MQTRMCDLPQELVGEKILTRVPITSLRAVRSTCKSCDALTKTLILGEAGRATHHYLGFMMMDSKVCSLRFHLKQKKGPKKKLVHQSVKQVGLLNQVEVSKVFHCDGLLLCVAKDNSKLVVWNPYLCQTRWIGPRKSFHEQDSYALGYDVNRNHKILRFVDDHIYTDVGPERVFGLEIFEFSSDSWRVLEVTPDWDIEAHYLGVSVKGSSYFFAREKLSVDIDTGNEGVLLEVEDFLLCFDFTSERFGPRLPLPFHTYGDECVTLSCVRDEQLSVLYYKKGVSTYSSDEVEIWVTTRIEPDSVSWSKFLKVEMRPFETTGVRFSEYYGGSFFVDEEEKVAVVFDLDGYLPTNNTRYQTAFIVGEDGYFKSVRIGKARNMGKPCPMYRYTPKIYAPALVCSSSYRPSLVQLNQPQPQPQRPRKRKERHV